MRKCLPSSPPEKKQKILKLAFHHTPFLAMRRMYFLPKHYLLYDKMTHLSLPELWHKFQDFFLCWIIGESPVLPWFQWFPFARELVASPQAQASSPTFALLNLKRQAWLDWSTQVIQTSDPTTVWICVLTLEDFPWIFLPSSYIQAQISQIFFN